MFAPLKRSRRAAMICSVLCIAAGATPALAAAAEGSYHLEKSVTIPGGDSGWDYNSIDPQHGRIFIAHRKDGLHVYDIKSGKVIKTLADSANANTSALAAEFDRGIAGTTDGYVIVFKLSTLQTVARYKSTTDGFDGAAYEPVSKRFAAVGEADLATKTTPVLFFDARTGKPAGSVLLHSVKVDAPRADGQGNIVMPLRDHGSIATIDARSMKAGAVVPVADCVKPAALELDPGNQRIFVGCRGDKSSSARLAVLDAASGKQVAWVPIGRGVDEVMYDARSKSVITANGEDGSMSVIHQLSADTYQVAETVGTRPMARTGVLDERSGKIYLVNAQYVRKYHEGQEAETSFLPNTFSVLTYSK
jgi:hypothetical protein